MPEEFDDINLFHMQNVCGNKVNQSKTNAYFVRRKLQASMSAIRIFSLNVALMFFSDETHPVIWISDDNTVGRKDFLF